MTGIIRLAGLLALSIGVTMRAEAAFKLEGEPKIALIYASTINDGGWTESLDYARVKLEADFCTEVAYVENIPENNAEVSCTIELYIDCGYYIIAGE